MANLFFRPRSSAPASAAVASLPGEIEEGSKEGSNAPAPTPLRAKASRAAAPKGVFGTETVAELCVRQGRPADAIVIFRRLIERKPDDPRASRWRERLLALESTQPEPAPSVSAPPPSPPSAESQPEPSLSPPAIAAAAAPSFPAAPAWAPALVVREPVRSGTVIYAEGRDLVVLAPVSSGAELISDGHIHVYAPLRGRAVAGARGAPDALIFCQRLEAELIGIDDAHLTAEELPPALQGKPVQIKLVDGALQVFAL